MKKMKDHQGECTFKKEGKKIMLFTSSTLLRNLPTFFVAVIVVVSAVALLLFDWQLWLNRHAG